MKRILVTDCWTNKALSVVRSLGLAGYEVHVVSHKRIAAAQYSAFVKKRNYTTDPYNDVLRYQYELQQLILTSDYDAVMALEEVTIKSLFNLSAEIKNNKPETTILVPDEKGFATANNKWETYQIAIKENVPAPLTFLPYSDEEIKAAIAKLGFPFIIKPCSSSGSRGIKKIEYAQEFDRHYHTIRKKYGAPMLQQYIERGGQGKGVGLLADKGKILTAYTYKRLREFPVNGGPGTLRETTKEPELITYAEKLIADLNYTGVAMVEFKMDISTDKPVLMEINPRYWGSLELAQVAGINFPDLWMRMASGEQLNKIEYRNAIRCRWLLPGDIAHFIANPDRFKLKPSFFNFFDKDTFYDEFKKYDIKGSVACIICTALSVFDPEIWKKGVFRT